VEEKSSLEKKGSLEKKIISGEFKPTRGLRQGDPLAPFLFIIVAEGLAGLVRQEVKCNFLKGVKVGRLKVESYLLQFVDDTLFMCGDSYHRVVTIKAIMRCYELASGLKINFRKSKLTAFNVERNTCECYAKTLHYAQMKASFKYLGLFVGGIQGRDNSRSLLWIKLKVD